MSDFDPSEFDEDCNCILCSYRSQFKVEQPDDLKKTIRRKILEQIHTLMRHIQNEEHFQISAGLIDTPYGHVAVMAGYPALIITLNRLGIVSSNQIDFKRLIIGEINETHKDD